MAKFTISIRRHNRESQDPPHWQDFEVDLAPENCVLDAILEARDRHDGSIGISCSCQGAICGSCGMQINGETMLACNTLLRDAAASHKTRNGTITLEPMGNMPVIKDLIVDMEAVHWKKIQQVKPWLMPAGDPPEREYIVPPESMLDITQTMACIQCGLCVSECLSLEVDPLFIGPAALAKAYRFVGDPRDAHTEERLHDLSEDPHGIYDCTHCFACVEACPKDVAPMDQIMRLRRRAVRDHDITDPNNGRRHEEGFVNVVEKKGLLDERKLLVDSFGMFRLKGQLELLRSLPTGLRGFLRGKITLKKALAGEKLESESL
ncbi:hypothetical protein LCGC14_3012010, partial [marine sediment metagenome]